MYYKDSAAIENEVGVREYTDPERRGSMREGRQQVEACRGNGRGLQARRSTDCTPVMARNLCEGNVQASGSIAGALCYVPAIVVLRVERAASPCEALLDTAASRSFISPETFERLQLKVLRLVEEHRFYNHIHVQPICTSFGILVSLSRISFIVQIVTVTRIAGLIIYFISIATGFSKN